MYIYAKPLIAVDSVTRLFPHLVSEKPSAFVLQKAKVLFSFLLQIFLTFPPPEEKSLEGGQLLVDVQYSNLQGACPSVCSSRVTAGDLRGDQGGLGLQVLRP